MSLMRRRSVALLAATTVALGACSSTRGPAAGDEALRPVNMGDSAGATASLEPPPEKLLQPPPANDTERLLRKSRQRAGLCNVLANLEALDEPAPDDLGDLIGYATAYGAALATFDPHGSVRNPESPTGAEIDVPSDVVKAVVVEQVAMFAYQARLSYTRTLLASGRIAKADLAPRLEYAWLGLTNSDYGTADQKLVRAARRFC